VGQKASASASPESRGTLSFEKLATRQGIQPVTDFESLLGHPSAEDESVEVFAALLREWRREGVA